MKIKGLLLDAIDIKDTPFYKKLEIIHKYDEIELDEKGNFPKDILQELVNSGVSFLNVEDENDYFEINLFKNLLLENRFYRKVKGKLLKVKKYQELSLEEKFKVIFLNLQIADILDNLNKIPMEIVDIDIVDKLLMFRDFDMLLASALNEVYKNNNDLFTQLLKSIFYQFRILKDNKLIVEIEKVEVSKGIIELKDINKKVANLFIDSILYTEKEFRDEDLEIIYKFFNTYFDLANNPDLNEDWYLKWLKKMAEYIDMKRLKKEVESIMSEFLLVSPKVQKDIVETIIIIENFEKFKKEEQKEAKMLVVMTLIEIFLNKNYGLFEGD